jgi:hypothetical protein
VLFYHIEQKTQIWQKSTASVKSATAGGVTTDTAITGTVIGMAMATGIEGTETEPENISVIVEMTDAATSVAVTSMTAGSVVVVTTMTVAENTAKRSASIGMAEVVRRDLLAVVVGVRDGMGLAPQNEGPLHLRVRFLWPSGGAKLLDGMFMLQDTNNIPPCRPNKQVFSTFLGRIARKFLPSLVSLVCHLQSQSRLLAWESGATRIYLDNPVASTLAVSHLRSMSKILPTSSTAK